MRWPEDTRLPRKIRVSRELFESCIRECEVLTSKREDMILDVLPLWGKIERNLSVKVKRNLRELCGYPLRGKHIQIEPPITEDEVVEKVQTGGWLEDDDIED